jgi:hypothetical protein
MIYMPQIILVLTASVSITSAYTITACTDGSCSENCVVLNGDDVDGTGPCNDFGFVAGSIELLSTNNVLDGWVEARGGCLDGPANEDAWIGDGNPANYCYDLASSEGAPEGIRYWLVNSSGQ